MRQLALLALLAVPLTAQAQSEAAFVTRLGRDTIAVERFTRTADRIEGELVAFAPATRVIRYVMNLTRAGTIVSGEVQVIPGEGAPGATPTAAITFSRRDTVITSLVQRGQRTDTLRVTVRPGTVPMVSPSVMPYEQMVMQAMRQGGDSVGVDLYSLGGRASAPNRVARRTADSVAVDYFGADHYLAVAADGRLLGLNGSRTTNKMMVERVEGPVDIRALAAAGVARERAGTATGALSTRDTVRATVAGADVTVDYGRPSVRGRQILGEVVPFGQVWRTGANTATHFTTSRDLLLGGTTVPAGSYTLWTLPTESGVQVILNRQTGQWGTEYDPSRDLVRLPADVAEARAPVERFTISVEPGSEGGVLVMSWHTFVWRVPFRVR